MSSPYEICLLFPNGSPRKATVDAVDELLRQMGATIAHEDSLALERTAKSDVIDEDIHDPTAALERLVAWPTGGGVSYLVTKFRVPVFFMVSTEGGDWTQVAMLLPSRGFDKASPEVRDKYMQLARRLHERLRPTRTIMAWGLETRGEWEREELKRLRNGTFEGHYPMLDLRN